MCKKRTSVEYITPYGKKLRIDSCLRNLIDSLNKLGIETIMCCCGHGRYDPTVIVRTKNNIIMEIFSGEYLNEARTYYKTDYAGYYYIPKLTEPIQCVKYGRCMGKSKMPGWDKKEE